MRPRHVNNATWCRSCASLGGVLSITRPFPQAFNPPLQGPFQCCGSPCGLKPTPTCLVKSCEKNSQDLAGELERLRERRSDQLFQYRSDRDEILAKVVESFDCVSVFYADGRCIYDWDKSGHPALSLTHSVHARVRGRRKSCVVNMDVWRRREWTGLARMKSVVSLRLLSTLRSVNCAVWRL